MNNFILELSAQDPPGGKLNLKGGVVGAITLCSLKWMDNNRPISGCG